MDERDILLEKIGRSETVQKPEIACLLGLWHSSQKRHLAAFHSFSAACEKYERAGFWAVSAWRSEWGGKPLPADFQARLPLASATFWALAQKPEEAKAALKRFSSSSPSEIRDFLLVFLPLLEGGGNFSPAPMFRSALESVLKSHFGVTSEKTRELLAEYDAGNGAAVTLGLVPVLESFFSLPPFCAIDYLWILFASGIGNVDFAAVSAALAELEKPELSGAPDWLRRHRAAGNLLLYFFLIRAAGENFERALNINPGFSRAAKNGQLLKKEKPELVQLIKQFSLF
jgi:hypothetical protein